MSENDQQFSKVEFVFFLKEKINMTLRPYRKLIQSWFVCMQIVKELFYYHRMKNCRPASWSDQEQLNEETCRQDLDGDSPS